MYCNRHRNKEEDEENLRRQTYLDNISRKKELIKSEFNKMEDEQKFDYLTIKTNIYINFKKLLNEVKDIKTKKQEKLMKIETKVHLLQNSFSKFSLDFITEKEPHLQTNSSFTKSFYKNKIFDPVSSKIEEVLRKKLCDIKQEIDFTKHNIENEMVNKIAIQSKLDEMENSKKKMLFQMNDFIFAKKMTFKRFDNVDSLLFNANAQKKMSLLNLNNIKNEIDEIKTIENDFLKQKFLSVQQKKHDLEKEQIELSKVLIQIDVNKHFLFFLIKK